MVPLEPALRRAYFYGLFVGIAFRWFFVFALRALLRITRPALCSIAGRSAFAGVSLVAWLVAAIFVPWVAGFLTAFFWRHIPWRFDRRDQTNARRTSTALAFLPLLLLGGCWAIPLVGFDALCFGRGLRQGEGFWNSRLGRQFLGDFSTPDDEENSEWSHRRHR